MALLRYPNSQLSIVSANSDGRIKEILNIAKGLLTDPQKSPYRDRIFVVLDSVHSVGLKQQIVAMGLPPENVVVWPKNGIEFFYSAAILDEIFDAGGEMLINDDVVSRNPVSYAKADLVDKVILNLRHDTQMHADFHEMLLKPLESSLGLPASA